METFNPFSLQCFLQGLLKLQIQMSFHQWGYTMPRADSQPFPKEAASEIKLGLRKKCFLRSRNVLDQIRSPVVKEHWKLCKIALPNITSFAYPEQQVITRESQPVLTALKFLPFFLRVRREGYLDLKTLFLRQSYEDSARSSLISLFWISVFSSVPYQADEHLYLSITNTSSDHPKAWWQSPEQNSNVLIFRPICDLQD